MAYAFFRDAISTVYAVISRDVGGSDYYHIPDALQSFATACNASFSSDATVPDGPLTIGSIECNTNTGDLTTEYLVDISFLTTASSNLSQCVFQQAQNLQGPYSCNASNPYGSSNTLGIVFGAAIGFLALAACCTVAVKKRAERLEVARRSSLIPRDRPTLFSTSASRPLNAEAPQTSYTTLTGDNAANAATTPRA